MNTVSKGRYAEATAINYLQNLYIILDYNYYTRFGEIDIVCFDNLKSEVVFVEVKSSSLRSSVQAVELFTTRKIQRIIHSIYFWLMSNPIFKRFNYRIDFIALTLDYYESAVNGLKHYENIGNF